MEFDSPTAVVVDTDRCGFPYWLRIVNLESGVHESVAGFSWRRVESSGHPDIGRNQQP